MYPVTALRVEILYLPNDFYRVFLNYIKICTNKYERLFKCKTRKRDLIHYDILLDLNPDSLGRSHTNLEQKEERGTHVMVPSPFLPTAAIPCLSEYTFMHTNHYSFGFSAEKRLHAGLNSESMDWVLLG